MAIVTASITEASEILDVSTSVRRTMFFNINKYILWDLIISHVKMVDTETSQMMYDGELRGQTERFTIAAGDLLDEFFKFIDGLFTIQDVQNIESSMLKYMQYFFGVSFTSNVEVAENVIREMLAEIISAWRLKGTKAFLHWIIWKVFGWKVVDVLSHHDYFKLNVSRIYKEGVSGIARLMVPLGIHLLVIDVFEDITFEEKRVVLERLMRGWAVDSQYIYINKLGVI